MIPITALLDVGMRVLERVIPDPGQRAAAAERLQELQQRGRLAELQADQNEADNVSQRHTADMMSDSWLSKNIRPLTLVFILVVYTVFAMMSAAGQAVTESYVTLLGQWGMLIMSFYFGGRTLEKILALRSQDTRATQRATE